ASVQWKGWQQGQLEGWLEDHYQLILRQDLSKDLVAVGLGQDGPLHC
ncbi:hypothetical protein L195_g064188, partial [Trifolium pratense]